MKEKLGKWLFSIDNEEYRFSFEKCNAAFNKLWEKRNKKKKLHKPTLEAEIARAVNKEGSTFHTWRYGPSSPDELETITIMAKALELESVLCLLVRVNENASNTQIETITTTIWNDDAKANRVVWALNILIIMIHAIFRVCAPLLAETVSSLLNFFLPESINMVFAAFGVLIESLILYQTFSFLFSDKRNLNRDSPIIENACFRTICCLLFCLISWAKI